MLPKRHLGAQSDHIGSKMDTHGGVFEDIFKFRGKMQTVFGPRRLDRIRVLALCFRPLGFLGASGGKAFPQDHPKGYINWNFSLFFQFVLNVGVP